MARPEDERYVAHLDILGMSAIVERNFELAWKNLSALVEVRDRVLSYELEFTDLGGRLPASDYVQMVTFSDTIVLYTEDGAQHSYLALLVLINEIFHKALCSCIPIRAGIAFGKFYVNTKKSMFAGPALIEAYRVGEEAQWLGIALADSLRASQHRLMFAKQGKSLFADWDVPIKAGVKNRKVLNWPFAYQDDLTASPPISVSQFYQAFESTFGAFEQLEASVQQKYVNTVHFMNSMLGYSSNT
jgi:hypothetical protein